METKDTNIVQFKSSNAFLMIPAGAAHDSNLLKKPKAILLLGEIISMLNVTQNFYASNREMARRLDCSPRTIQDYLNFLEKEKLIIRDVEKDENGEVKGRNIYAGERLGELFAQGWKPDKNDFENTPRYRQRDPHVTDNTTPHVTDNVTPHVTDNVTPTLQTTYKYNSVIEHDNKTVSSSDKKLSKNKLEKMLKNDFEEVWKIYPKKQGKKDALRHYMAWRKEDKNHTNDFLIKKLNEYIKYIKYNNIEFRFIKNGSTWFNGGYEDDYSIGKDNNNGNNTPENYGYDELFGNQ